MVSAAMWMTTGRCLRDAASGMRLYKRNIINRLVENAKFAPEPDTVAYLMRMGADVHEVKVEMEERTSGQSYLTPFNATKYMIRVLLAILIFQWSWQGNRLERDTDKLKGRRSVI